MASIDQLLADQHPPQGFDEPFEIPLTLALDILTRIEPTLLMEKEDGYDFDWDAARAALKNMCEATAQTEKRDKVWCLVRQDRNLSREVPSGHAVFSDAPDTTRSEGNVARAIAINTPMLI